MAAFGLLVYERQDAEQPLQLNAWIGTRGSKLKNLLLVKLVKRAIRGRSVLGYYL